MRAIGPAALIRSRPQPAEFFPLLCQLVDDMDDFDTVLRQLPLNEFKPTRPGDDRFLPFFYEMLRHPEPDAWTSSLLVTGRHTEIKVPSLSIAGWHDLLLAGDLQHFRSMRESAGSDVARRESRLIIGPWAHAMFHNVVGEVDFGFRANGLFLDMKEDLTRLQLRWFDRWMKQDGTGDPEAPVKIFVQGRNRWRDEQEWPPARAQLKRWYLNGDGSFGRQHQVSTTAARSYVYDPNDPCPTCGGSLLLPTQYTPGPVEQAPIRNRPDVLEYTSEVLQADLEVTGELKAVLYVATSGRDTDFMVKLCDVHPDGRTLNVCDGVLRLSLRDGRHRVLVEPNARLRVEVDLWSTSMVFKAGHRLRVLITSSDFPRYDRNPNTGELAHEATTLEPALQRVFHDEIAASHLLLPEIPTDA